MVNFCCSLTHVIKCSPCNLSNLHNLLSYLVVKIAASTLAIGLCLHSSFVKNLVEMSVVALHWATRDALFVFCCLLSVLLKFNAFVFERSMGEVILLNKVR